jgi:hypothetical protein
MQEQAPSHGRVSLPWMQHGAMLPHLHTCLEMGQGALLARRSRGTT